MDETNTAQIPLSNGGCAIVDIEFAYLKEESKYNRDKNGYARTCIRGNRIRLHTLIMGKKEGYEIDHINRDKLDNRKSNLRFVTHAENNINRKGWGKSGVKNVQYRPNESRIRPFVVAIKCNGIKHSVGRFSTLDEAIDAVHMFYMAM